MTTNLIKRWRARRPDWEKRHRIFLPVVIGIAYAVLAFDNAVESDTTTEMRWVLAGFYVLFGAMWGFIVWVYGRTIRSNTEHAARFTGIHPPEGAWVEYADGERFEQLPLHYVGISRGLEVWEVMLPRNEPPQSMGAKRIPGLTQIIAADRLDPEGDR